MTVKHKTTAERLRDGEADMSNPYGLALTDAATGSGPKRTGGQRFDAGSTQTHFFLDVKELDAAVERLVAAYDKFKTGRQS